MLHQHTLHFVQGGFKYFFDIDPVLTEHVIRNLVFQAAVISSGTGMMIRDLTDRFGDVFTPVIHELRNLRLTIPGF